jgi:cytochrome c biogenesis protein
MYPSNHEEDFPLKNVKRWLFSMHFGIFLLVLIALYVTVGTLLPQELPPAFYLDNYALGSVMVALGFHQTYSSAIFRTIMVLLLINLTGCTVKLIPSQLRRYRQGYFPSLKPNAENLWPGDASPVEMTDTIRSLGFRVVESPDEPGVFQCTRHRLGVFGSTITHLGILIIVLGSFAGNYFALEGFFNLMPGESAHFNNENFSVRLDDFYMTFREDGSTEQYYSDLLILEEGREPKKETIWVNRPYRHSGMILYQSSFGWASRLSIRDQNTGEVVLDQYLRNDETVFFQPAHLNIHLFGYFPDFQMNHSGMPVTLTQEARNPHYAVVLYHFGEYVDSFIMNPEQRFTYQGYEIRFDDSVLYTGLIYRKDFGYYYFLIGCVLLLTGLMLAFYFYPKYILIKDGSLYTITRQNSWGFSMWLKRQLNKDPMSGGD